MNENIKTETFKIVEIKPGLYVQQYNPAQRTVQVTDDIKKSRKYDVFSNESRPCATEVKGDIKELKVTWEVG